MSGRVSLPANLTGSASLTRSGEGVTFANPASLPGMAPSPALSPVLPTTTPSVVVGGPIPAQTATTVINVTDTTQQKPGYRFNPLNIIWLILIFLAVFLILYMTKGNLVTDLVNGERVLNNGKLIFWAVLITLIIAVIGFALFSWKK